MLSDGKAKTSALSAFELLLPISIQNALDDQLEILWVNLRLNIPLWVDTLCLNIPVNEHGRGRLNFDALASLAPLFESLGWLPAGHAFFKRFRIESDFPDQTFS